MEFLFDLIKPKIQEYWEKYPLPVLVVSLLLVIGLIFYESKNQPKQEEKPESEAN